MLDRDREHGLLDRIAAGDRDAAEDLVDATYGRVFALLVRLSGDRETAADLTQETYRKAWASLSSFDRRARLSTWLHRIAYNAFLNHGRRRRPVPVDDAGMPERLAGTEPGPAERMDRREVALRLRRAVLGLPDPLRFTITARFWADLPVREIAEIENVTGAAIRKRLKKARTELRTALEEDAA